MAEPSDQPAQPADWLLRRRRLDTVLRLQAAVMLGDPAHSEAIRVLSDALGDSDMNVRETAAAALSEFGPEARSAIPNLIRATQDEDEVVRRRAIRAIGFIVDPVEAPDTVVPVLIAATEDADPGVSLQAVATLSEFGVGAASALPAFLAALWTGGVRMRALAGNALIKLGEIAVPSLIESLSHPAAEVRTKAAYILGRIGPAASAAIPALQLLRTDPDEFARTEAGEALARIGTGSQ